MFQADELSITMPPTIPSVLWSQIVWYFFLHWHPDDIACKIKCTIERIQVNMLLYDSVFSPH